MLLTQQLCGILCGGSAIWGQYLLFVASSYNKEVYFIIWWANFHFVFKPPAATIISILSVAFSVIYSEWNLAKSPLLSGIGRKFFKFFARGTLPPSMTFLTGLNAFVCRFLVSDWVFSVSVKNHTDLLISWASLLESLFVQPALLHFATSYKW